MECLVLILEEHKVDEEDSAEEEHASDTVSVSRELDVEVISVGEELLDARELLADESAGSRVVGVVGVEDLDLVVIPDAAATAELVDNVVGSIADREEGAAGIVLLAGGAEELVGLDTCRASVDVHRLVAAGVLADTAGAAHRAVVELTLHTDDLALVQGADGHRELATDTAALAAETRRLFFGVHDGRLGSGGVRIVDMVLVAHLKGGKSLKNTLTNILLDDKRAVRHHPVHHGIASRTGCSNGNSRNSHHGSYGNSHHRRRRRL